MKKNFKKIFLFVAVVVTALACFAFMASAVADTGQCGDNVYWNFNDKTKDLVISGSGPMYDYEYVYSDADACYVSSSPFANRVINRITINDGVTSIGKMAFVDCSDIIINIPVSVVSIGEKSLYSRFGGLGEIIVYYSGTREQWEMISIGSDNNCLEDAIIYFNGEASCTHPDTTTYSQQNPTCTEVGYTAGVYCPDCETWLDGHEVIEASHTDADTDKFCEVCDSYIGVLYGTGKCGDNVNYEWYEDGMVIISGTGPMADYENHSSSPFYSSNIKSVVINDGVTTIGDYAFYRCRSLTEVTIPDSVTTIGDEAFAWCDSLTEVTIPDSVTTIGNYAFACCDSLTSIIIPDSVTTIGAYAFSGCSKLAEVTIGNSVTTIGDYAFYDCDSLTDVYYVGTQEQWKKISIGSGNSDLTGANIHYNYCVHANKESKPQQNATCTEIGYTAGTYCPDCEKWLEGHKEIPATNHANKENKPQQNATCTEIGYTAGTYCPDCEKWLDGHTKISAKGHTFTEKIIDDKHLKSKATVEAAAIYKYDCAACDEISSDKTFTHGKALTLGITGKITVAQTTSTITLTWDKAENATGYRLYYKLPGDLSWRQCISYTTATSYTFNNLPSGQSYRFAVRSAYVKADGGRIYGGYKEIATATKAVAPSKITSAQNTTAIRLTWSKCPGATGYRIFYKSGNTWKTCLNATTATTHTFTGLKAGSKFTFAVRPYIVTDSGVVWSDYTTYTASTLPAIPKTAVTSPSSGKITVKWNAVSGAEAYQLYYKTGNGSYKLYYTYTTPQNLTFSGLKSGTKYTFAVRAAKNTSGGWVFGSFTPVSVTVK